jgi:hypothetical protein
MKADYIGWKTAYELKSQGMTWIDVGSALGISDRNARRKAYKWCVLNNLPNPNTNSMIKYADTLAKLGMKHKDIARLLGIPYRTLRDKFYKLRDKLGVIVPNSRVDKRILAFELREKGLKWSEVAIMAGYKNANSCMASVNSFIKQHTSTL